jgi:hypothetical protein
MMVLIMDEEPDVRKLVAMSFRCSSQPGKWPAQRTARKRWR